jgi:ProP effector
MPEIDPGELRVAMRQHTASTRYLKELAKGASRYNLDDQAEGTITPEQKAQASDALRERFRKAADQRKAEMQARERQEKLLQLADKFNTR